jgi:hypothetical protein
MHADPDLDKTLPAQKVEILNEKYTYRKVQEPDEERN